MDEKKIRTFQKVKSEADVIETKGGARAVGLDLGMCTNCSNLSFKRRRYGSYTAYCTSHPFTMSVHEEDPVTTCTEYYPRGQLSLAQMVAIATPIEEKKKDKVGFYLGEEYDKEFGAPIELALEDHDNE